jgi:uncharacterized membrane protein
MSAYIVPSLTNGLAVALGLFVLWSFVGGMKKLPASTRGTWAVVAGIVSAVVTFVVTAAITGSVA